MLIFQIKGDDGYLRNAYYPAAASPEAHSQMDQSEPTCLGFEFAGLQDSEWKCKFEGPHICQTVVSTTFPTGGKCISRRMRNPIKSSAGRGLDLGGRDLNIE